MLTGPQKSLAALIITALSTIAGALVTYWPDDPNVQHWGQGAVALFALLATTLGVYIVPNKTGGPATPATSATSPYAAGGILTFKTTPDPDHPDYGDWLAKLEAEAEKYRATRQRAGL
jgi:hypothetical protein